ncbi:Uncharacterised protein [Bordetella pertussis]|nr:Uncharacterised protein [Bordetella pertussis]
MPSTTSGRISASLRQACAQARANRNGSFSSAAAPRPRTPWKRRGTSSMPRGGTSRPSILSGLPSHSTRQPRSRSTSATARPGMMWPPVPPAMMRMVGALIPGLPAS